MFELLKAQKALKNGDREKAESYFKKILNKPNVDALIYYGYEMIREGRAQEALSLFDVTLLPLYDRKRKELEEKITPKNKGSITQRINAQEIKVYSNYAIALWQCGNLQKAIEVTERLFEKYKNTVLYGNLTFYYILSKDNEKALNLAKEAYDFAPDDASILDNLGYSLFENGQLEESEKVYQKLMEKNPAFPDAYNNYASVLIALDKKQEAKQILQKCLSCNFTALTLAKRDDVEKIYKEL